MTSPVQASKTFTKAELCLMEQIPEPCAIVIFGASGDLTYRKLIPSLFYLQEQSLLSKQYYIVGVGRTPFSDQAFQDKVIRSLPRNAPIAHKRSFTERFRYVTGDYSDPATYLALSKYLDELDKIHGVKGNRLFYLSIPPSLYSNVIEQLGLAKLTRQSANGNSWVRVIIEKPFGSDLSSAEKLNLRVHRWLQEDQVYRIDHYLGKETVQNIMIFRFANILFEQGWNRNTIDHVQITAAEELGVEHRAGYYDQAGVLRDMFPNHLFQLLALIAMEPPSRFEADAVRDRKLDIFRSIRPWSPLELTRNAVRGQYSAGSLNGQRVIGYREEEGVRRESATPTFAAVRLEIDNWRWQGVPFYLRSGKRMAERVTEIAVQFKHVPVSIFQPLLTQNLAPNVLRFRIQPDEQISISFEAKHPGPKLCMSTVTMNFGYEETFGMPPPAAYARLFHDSMTGDQTLFARSDGVEQCWRVLDPLLEMWGAQGEENLAIYPAGSWGPSASAALLSRDGRTWDLPYIHVDN